MDAPLKGPNGTPLSDMDGFSPAKNGISELFSSGRTGLTPSGPIGKTPVGGYGGQPGRPVAAARPLQGPIYSKSGRRRADE